MALRIKTDEIKLSVLGIAIVALPAGIITAEYMEEINKREDKKEQS